MRYAAAGCCLIDLRDRQAVLVIHRDGQTAMQQHGAGGVFSRREINRFSLGRESVRGCLKSWEPLNKSAAAGSFAPTDRFENGNTSGVPLFSKLPLGPKSIAHSVCRFNQRCPCFEATPVIFLPRGDGDDI